VASSSWCIGALYEYHLSVALPLRSSVAKSLVRHRGGRDGKAILSYMVGTAEVWESLSYSVSLRHPMEVVCLQIYSRWAEVYQAF